jgi:hypothetical protein
MHDPQPLWRRMVRREPDRKPCGVVDFAGTLRPRLMHQPAQAALGVRPPPLPAANAERIREAS